MNPDLNTVIDAALKLPPEQLRELIVKLTLSNTSSKIPGAVEKHFGTFKSGDPRFADNDRIDEDLATEYSDTHEFEN